MKSSPVIYREINKSGNFVYLISVSEHIENGFKKEHILEEKCVTSRPV